MEEYEDVGSNALIAYNATDATDTTTEGQEQEAGRQSRQIMGQPELETEEIGLGNLGVLKATSGNAAKRWKMRQETRATTRAGKSAEAAIKQIATQKLQAEKEKMREWKQFVMQEVVRELHVTKKAHEEAMEAQRYGFVMELEKVREELRRVESRLTRLEYEMNTLKGQKRTPEPCPTQDTLATQNTPIIPSRIKPPKGKEPTNPPRKSYAQMAASGLPKITTKKAWTEVTGSSRKRKATTSSTPKVEPEKKRVIFRQEALSPQKSEADLMLALNESLQKAEISAYTRFSKMRYL